MYSVELDKQQLTFSAAHFITFETAEGDEICESLHGHNYAVRCVVEGELKEQGYVVDFIALRDALARIVKRMDHRVLLPSEHPRITVTTEGKAIQARYGDRKWLFPHDDCLVLPVSNTTAELIARFVCFQLKNESPGGFGGLQKVSVGIDENQGQWGWYHHRIS